MKIRKLIISFILLVLLAQFGYLAFAEDSNVESKILQITKFDSRAQSADNFKKDDYVLEDIAIEGDVLVLTVQYGGGCTNHEFKLMWNGLSTESIPGIVGFSLYHDAKGDLCYALPTKKLRFDLSSVGEDTAIDFIDYYGKVHRICYNVKEGGIPGVCPEILEVPNGKICPAINDVKICPDGTSVGRNPDNCEFDSCPDSSIKTCDTVGLRKGREYCSADKIWQEQKGANYFCENHFECNSNFCVDEKCVDKGFLRKIIDLIKNLFGF